MGFVYVAGAEEITAGKMKAFNIEGEDVLIINLDGRYYAIGNKCTHRGGDLSKGKLEGNIVTCPRHGSQFDITTGKCIVGPKIGPLKLGAKDEPFYQVKLEDGKIMIGL